MLKPHLDYPFAVTYVPDARLGQAVTLLLAGCSKDNVMLKQALQQLPRYYCPRHIFEIDEIPMTGTSKIDRKACAEYAAKQLQIG